MSVPFIHRGLQGEWCRADHGNGAFRRTENPRSAFAEFVRFDRDEILRKERGTERPRILRLLIGNPLIMKQMVAHVPDAASYASVTMLIDERADRVHLSYDRMAGFLS